MQRLKERLDLGQPDIDNITRIMSVVAIAGLFSMFLPWISFDGDKSALTGSELIAFAFTSSERSAMFGISVPGALGLFLVPITMVGLTIFGFFKTVNGEHPLPVNGVAVMLPIAMLILSSPITSSDQVDLFGVILPKVGIVLMILSHAALFIHGLYAELLTR